MKNIFKHRIMKKESLTLRKKHTTQFNHFVTGIVSLVVGGMVYLLTRNPTHALASFLAFLVLGELYQFTKKKLEASVRVRQMEEVFPDFIELVSSNLRAG